MNFEDIKIYLPKFLSSESEKELFQSLRDFPENIDTRLYTEFLNDERILFQGDGIKDELLVVNLPNRDIRPAPSMILSNTCDIDISNERNFPSRIVYAPIFNLGKYEQMLLEKSKKTKQQIGDHIDSVRKQEVTQMFYLPKYSERLDESIVFLDRVNNYPTDLVNRAHLQENRIFTLSDFGAYLFVLKLSIHFTRIQDNVERKSLTS